MVEAVSDCVFEDNAHFYGTDQVEGDWFYESLYEDIQQYAPFYDKDLRRMIARIEGLEEEALDHPGITDAYFEFIAEVHANAFGRVLHERLDGMFEAVVGVTRSAISLKSLDRINEDEPTGFARFAREGRFLVPDPDA